jgi:hypothetical protein
LFWKPVPAQALDFIETDGVPCVPSATTVQYEDSRTKVRAIASDQALSRQSGSPIFSFTTLGISAELCGRSAVFGNAFADKFPLGDAQDGGYKLYIAMFMVVTVPLACASIKDQLGPNVIETARFVMAILMVGTIAGAYGADEPHFGSQVDQ